MDIILFLKSLLLGAIQGFTEFLPISSTAHLILSVNLLNIEFNDFIKSFIIIIQLASILAVVLFYFNKIIKNISYIKKIIIAFIPTAILGLVFYKFVKNFLQESIEIIGLALFLGGLAMLFLEKKNKKREEQLLLNNKSSEGKIESIEDISYKNCFIIGVFQSLAMIPGVSRSAATILGGLSLGISRLAIVEFSFLLAIPTMAAASFLDIIKSGFNFSHQEFIFLTLGFISSFIVSWFSIKFLLNFIKKNSFVIFAWYRIIIGSLIFFFLYS